LQKKKLCINTDTACATVQGKDELSQIKKGRTREGGEEQGGGIQCTFIQYFFFNGFSSRHWESENRSQKKTSQKNGHGLNQNTRIITQDRVKHKTEKMRRGKREKRCDNSELQRGPSKPKTGRHQGASGCIHVCCNDVWSGRKERVR